MSGSHVNAIEAYPGIYLQSVAYAEERGLSFPTPNIINLIINKIELPCIKLADRMRKHSHQKKLTAKDLIEAFQTYGYPPVYGYKNCDSMEIESIGQVGTEELFVPKDRQINLDDLAKATLKPYPTDKFFSFHWLAVQGAQPRISENLNEPVLDGVVGDELTGAPAPLKMSDQSVQITSSRAEIPQSIYSEYKQILEQNIKIDQQILVKLETDATIQPLLPHIMRNISSPIPMNPQYVEIVMGRMHVCRRLFMNKNIDVDTYLEKFISLGLTALISQTSDRMSTDSYALRETAADFLKTIIEGRADTYPDLKQRIADYLLRIFFDGHKQPCSQKLGAAIGLSAIGPEIVRHIFIPALPAFFQRIHETADISDYRMNFPKLKAVVMSICGECFSYDTNIAREKANGGIPKLPEDVAEMYNNLIPIFGTDFFLYASHGSL